MKLLHSCRRQAQCPVRILCRAPGAGTVTRLGLEEHKILRQTDGWGRTEGVCVGCAVERGGQPCCAHGQALSLAHLSGSPWKARTPCLKIPSLSLQGDRLERWSLEAEAPPLRPGVLGGLCALSAGLIEGVLQGL